MTTRAYDFVVTSPILSYKEATTENIHVDFLIPRRVL